MSTGTTHANLGNTLNTYQMEFAGQKGHPVVIERNCRETGHLVGLSAK